MNRNGRKKNLSFHHMVHGRVAQTMGSEENVRVFKPSIYDKMVELLPSNKSGISTGMEYSRSFDKKSSTLTAPVPVPVMELSKSLEKKSHTGTIPAQEFSRTFEKKSHLGSIDQRIMMTNKACYVVPDQQDFGQLTSSVITAGVGVDDVEQGLTKYHDLLLEQYGFDLVVHDGLKDLKITNLSANALPKNNSSQYANPHKTTTDTDGTPWLYVDNVEDIDQYLKEGKPFRNDYPKKVRVAETPRVRVVAEKYSKIKKNHIELRKLEEKIVCVEYDVFDKDLGYFAKPVQVMRAFFSIKTGCELCNGGKMLSAVPETLREQLDIQEGDVKQLTEKEIEVIDDKIAENKPYLEDLKKVLKKKRVINDMKKKSTLDLMCMYEMAKRDHAPLDPDFSNANLLSIAELEEIKQLILNRCDAGGYGICRRTMTTDNGHSDSLFYQMLADIKFSSGRC